MKIYTSYFYQVRFMKPWHIPLSTAVWDPKWFHQFKNQNWIFKDKNGVYNGLRAEPFMPVVHGEAACSGRPCNKNPLTCEFLQQYWIQLQQLNIDDIIARCEQLGSKIQKLEGFAHEPEYIFLVHEAPSNLCSERGVIQKWFKDKGYDVSEWLQGE